MSAILSKFLSSRMNQGIITAWQRNKNKIMLKSCTYKCYGYFVLDVRKQVVGSWRCSLYSSSVAKRFLGETIAIMCYSGVL